MDPKSGPGFRERLKARREQRRTRRIERAMPRQAASDHPPGRGGIKASRGGAGGGGTG